MCPAELVLDPYPVYRTLREREPVTWVAALGMWWVLDHSDVVDILGDDETFTTVSADSLILGTFGEQMLSSEGEAHKRYRRVFRPTFQSRALRDRLEADIERWTDQLIDGFGSGGAELRAGFAAQLPVRTMLGLFGLSEVEVPRLRRWYDAFEAALANFERSRAVVVEAEACVAEFHALLRDGIANGGDAPGPGLLAALAGGSAMEPLSDDEICRNASIIMFGGISTVEALILNTIWTLAIHPDIEARVREDLSLLPAVIEEVLRWQSPVQSATRHAVRDVEFRGHRIRAGDTVNCMLAAANRDPSFHADPDRFDPDRDPPPRHLTFATGPHFCLGLHLARLEARIALARLYSRIPDLRVEAPLDHRPKGFEFRQPARLHALWGEAPQAAACAGGTG